VLSTGSRPKAIRIFYCDPETLLGLLVGFELMTVSQQLQERRPGSRHWHIIAERSG
jgi:hypothetical protein